MGMEQRVHFADGALPRWSKVTDLLGQRGFPLQMRMIDNELAMPDEKPPDDWRELRVSTPAGMITLRRAGAAVDVVAWGNADEAMRQAWNALAWALAEVGKGKVGELDADAFHAQAELPAGCH